MAILSNVNGKFAVDSTGAIQFSGSAGTSGYILRSNGNAAPTWVDASTVIGGPYLPLTGGTLSGATATASGISFTVGGALTVSGNATFSSAVFTGGKLGVGTSDPGAEGYSFAEDLVILGGNSASDGAGITIRNNGKRYSVIAFGNGAGATGNDNDGEIFYDQTNKTMNFRTNHSPTVTFTNVGKVIAATATVAADSANTLTTKGYVDGLPQGDLTAITVGNGLAGTSLGGPIPDLTMSGSYTGTFTSTAVATDNIITSAGSLIINDPLDQNSNLIIAGRYDLGSTTLSFRSGHGGNTNVWDMATILVEDDSNYNGRIMFKTSPSGYGNTPTTKMTIRSSGAIAFGTSITNYGTSGQVLTSAGNTTPTWTTPTTGTVTGTGTNDYIPKWNAAGTGIENSLLIDTGALSYTTSQSVILTLKGTSAPGYAEINIKNDANNFINIGSIGSTYSGADWTNSAYVYNTGTGRNLWLKSQNDLGLFAGGTSITSNKRMTILSAGNIQMTTKLAIGATTPQNYRLQLGLNGSLVDSIAMGNYAVAKNTRQYIGYTRADTGLFESSGNGDTPSTVLAGVAGVRIVNTEGTVASTQADNSVQLLTHIYNGSSRVALHANYDGKVGIGTTGPGAKLDVRGTGNFLGTAASGAALVTIENNSGSTATSYGLLVKGGGNSASGKTFEVRDDSGNTDLIVKGNGNVGIGTTAPTSKLHVNGTGATHGEYFRISNGTTQIYELQPSIYNVTNNGFGIYDVTDSTYRLVIDTNGKVGIGTTSPDSLLQLESSANPDVELKISNTATVISGQNFGGSKIRLIADGTNGDGEGALRHALVSETDSYDNWEIRTGNELGTLAFDTLGSERMRITSGGDVLFGKTSQGLSIVGIEAAANATLRATKASSAPAEFNRTGSDGGIVLFYKNTASKGNISITSSAVAYNTSSDYRLKEDLQDFAGLDMVSKIPVYDFKWKTDESRSYGVMAHELQEVLPDAVSGEKDAEEMQGVDYSKIVPLLVKSIQELEAKIKKLENK